MTLWWHLLRCTWLYFKVLEVIRYLILSTAIDCLLCFCLLCCSESFKLVVKLCHAAPLAIHPSFHLLVEAFTGVHGALFINLGCSANRFCLMFTFGAANAVLDPGLRGLSAVHDLTDVRCLGSLIPNILLCFLTVGLNGPR